MGKTNNQTIGVSSSNAPKVSLRPNSRVETVDQSSNETNNYELPTWVYVIFGLLFIVGWSTDTPSTIIKGFKKK